METNPEKKESELTRKMSNMANEIFALEGASKKLLERLAYVSSEEECSSEVVPATPSTGSSQFCRDLESFFVRIEGVRMLMENTLSGLEI